MGDAHEELVDPSVLAGGIAPGSSVLAGGIAPGSSLLSGGMAPGASVLLGAGAPVIPDVPAAHGNSGAGCSASDDSRYVFSASDAQPGVTASVLNGYDVTRLIQTGAYKVSDFRAYVPPATGARVHVVKPPQGLRMPHFDGVVGSNGKEGTAYMRQFIAIVAELGIDLKQPGALFKQLFIYKKGVIFPEWLDSYAVSFPAEKSEPEHLWRLFIERFDLQVRSDASLAEEKLLSGTVKMRQHDNVAAYLARFRDVVQRVPAMPVSLRIRYFQQGLSPALSRTCAVNFWGKEFATFEQLIEHVLGEERKMTAHVNFEPNSRAPGSRRGSRQGNNGMIVVQGAAVERASWQSGASGRGRGGEVHNVQRAGPPAENVLSWVKDMAGNRISKIEYQRLRELEPAHCFNCWERGHTSTHCRAEQRDYGKGKVPGVNGVSAGRVSGSGSGSGSGRGGGASGSDSGRGWQGGRGRGGGKRKSRDH